MIDSKTTHITPADGNVFLDLGFDKVEAESLLADSQKWIAEKVSIKKTLIAEIISFISERNLKQSEAAQILGVSRPRVSDLTNCKTVKFSIDSLVDMLERTGKQVTVTFVK